MSDASGSNPRNNGPPSPPNEQREAMVLRGQTRVDVQAEKGGACAGTRTCVREESNTPTRACCKENAENHPALSEQDRRLPEPIREENEGDRQVSLENLTPRAFVILKLSVAEYEPDQQPVTGSDQQLHRRRGHRAKGVERENPKVCWRVAQILEILSSTSSRQCRWIARHIPIGHGGPEAERKDSRTLSDKAKEHEACSRQ